MASPVACPKCGCTLEPEGEVTVDDRTFPVYLCESCVQVADVMGEPFEVCYSFCLDESGRPFDPIADDIPPRPISS